MYKQFINEARQVWIDTMMQNCPDLKYVKQLSMEEVAALVDKKEDMEFIEKKMTGKEIAREMHLFEMKDGIPMIAQWRWVPKARKYNVECKAEGSDKTVKFKMNLRK